MLMKVGDCVNFVSSENAEIFLFVVLLFVLLLIWWI